MGRRRRVHRLTTLIIVISVVLSACILPEGEEENVPATIPVRMHLGGFSNGFIGDQMWFDVTLESHSSIMEVNLEFWVEHPTEISVDQHRWTVDQLEPYETMVFNRSLIATAQGTYHVDVRMESWKDGSGGPIFMVGAWEVLEVLAEPGQPVKLRVVDR